MHYKAMHYKAYYIIIRYDYVLCIMQYIGKWSIQFTSKKKLCYDYLHFTKIFRGYYEYLRKIMSIII